MFLGHFGLGLAAKKIDKRPSLGTLFMASQFIDLLWPFFLLIGIEKVKIEPGNTAVTPLNFLHYPFSHGFISVLIWSVLFGAAYYVIRRNMKGSLLTGSLVMSHWVLDLITHRPDLPLAPWSDVKVGFGLWNSMILTFLLELPIFFGGAFIYLKATSPENNKGSAGFWSLIVFLTVVYLMNIFGPPPPSEGPIAYVGFTLWLLIAWAFWVDKNRHTVN
jgi:hypothetical protein